VQYIVVFKKTHELPEPVIVKIFFADQLAGRRIHDILDAVKPHEFAPQVKVLAYRQILYFTR
jgi:hypothetical protein